MKSKKAINYHFYFFHKVNIITCNYVKFESDVLKRCLYFRKVNKYIEKIRPVFKIKGKYI